MSVIFFVFYAIVVVTIIVNALKIVKAFRDTHSSILNNIQNMTSDFQAQPQQRYTNNTKQDEVNLDDYMKSNTNPIKEKRGKRSNI